MQTWRSLFIVAALAGCAIAPQVQPRKAPSSGQTAEALEARSLDASGVKQFIEQNLQLPVSPWPIKRWDLSLLALAAFYYHPDLDIARVKWAVAQAGMITAGARPNPTFGAGAQYNSSARDGEKPWTVGINLDIPIETANKRGYRVQQAKYVSQSSRYNIAQVAWVVRSRVRTALLDLSAARDSEAILQKQEAIQAEIFKLLEQRLKYGMASQPEVTQATIALDQTRLALKDANKQSAEARARLAAAIGVPAIVLNGIDLFLPLLKSQLTLTGISVPDARRQALTGRPDILAALADYQASQAALQLEVAKQVPDIKLGPGFTWDAGALKWGLGFSITLPVFSNNEGPIAEAEARRKLAAASVTALQSRIISDMDEALASYQASLQKIATADTLIAAQQKRQDAITRQFKAGEADKLQLTSGKLESVAIELLRSSAIINAQQALNRLEDALERPIDGSAFDSSMTETHPRKEESKR